MYGYLQCLINQCENKKRKALGGEERTIYTEVLNDLIQFQKYIQEPQDSTIKDIPEKHMAIKYVGTMPGLIEYLKNLGSEQGGIK